MSTDKNKIILLGGGGHAKVLIDVIEDQDQYKIVGILDPLLKVGIEVSRIRVLGKDNMISELYDGGVQYASICIAGVKDNRKREKLFEMLKNADFSLPSLIHTNTVVSGKARVSDAVQIMPGALINSNAVIGKNTIIDTGAIIEHDCRIGSHAHICPGVIVCGEVCVGDRVFIGAGTTIIQGIKIGDDSIVGAGSVVVKDVLNGTTVMGVPAK